MSTLAAGARIIRETPAPPVRRAVGPFATTPPGRAVLMGLSCVGLLLVVIIGVTVGATRMITAAADPARTHQHTRSAVGYRFSTTPLGFTVRWSDGSSETHLWW